MSQKYLPTSIIFLGLVLSIQATNTAAYAKTSRLGVMHTREAIVATVTDRASISGTRIVDVGGLPGGRASETIESIDQLFH